MNTVEGLERKSAERIPSISTEVCEVKVGKITSNFL